VHIHSSDDNPLNKRTNLSDQDVAWLKPS
jgi:hypothetical protein